MLKKLRLRFVCINLVIAGVMLCIILGLVLHFTADSLANESIRMMQSAASGPPEPLRPEALPENVRLPYFILQLNLRGQLTVIGGDGMDLSDQGYLRELAAAALETGTQTGVLNDYGLRYYRGGAPDRQCLVFADMSSEQATMRNLTESCLVIGLAALAGFFVISLFLARWAIRPVEQAWQQQKQFVADASHELKTPLTVIHTNAELLQEGAEDLQLRQRSAENILVMARQMRGLVEGLLELARVDNGNVRAAMEPVDLSRLVSDGLLPFEPLYFEHRRELAAWVEPGLRVQGSPAHLRQVLEILLDNAMKYSAPGAQVRVSLRRYSGHALLTVADPGPALSPEKLKDIFKRFYRVDKARSRDGSYGLGLSIAQRVVEEHRGRIWAESRGGINSFFVQLPLTSGRE